LNHALFFDGVTIWNQPTRPQTSNEQILKQGMSYSSSNPWAHELEKKKGNFMYFFYFFSVTSNHALFFSCGTIWNQPTSPQTSQ
jgi:hypothetical protein